MFDDSQEVDSLLGIVEVPLLPLAHGKDISGMFEISNRALGGGAVGVMAVKMEWSMSYLPPSSVPDILTPDPSDRSDRVYSCDVDIGKLSSFVFILSLYSLSLFFVFILCFFLQYFLYCNVLNDHIDILFFYFLNFRSTTIVAGTLRADF